jgi:hypothetical protein
MNFELLVLAVVMGGGCIAIGDFVSQFALQPPKDAYLTLVLTVAWVGLFWKGYEVWLKRK